MKLEKYYNEKYIIKLVLEEAKENKYHTVDQLAQVGILIKAV